MKSPASRRRSLALFTSSSTTIRVAAVAVILGIALLCLNLTTARLASPTATAGSSVTSHFSPALAPAPLVVNTTTESNDANPGDGVCADTQVVPQCSLRAAIEEANANPDADTINFAIVTGLQPIVPGSSGLGPLPQIIHPVTIDGYTQPGSSANTLAVGDNAVINIELNGISAGAGADGLNIAAGNSAVRGLAIYRFGGDGIELNTNGGNTITGNFIGLQASGTGNGNLANGINIPSGTANTIGGATPQARNVISLNSDDGVDLGSASNTVQGNYIGINKDGTAGMGNGVSGVFIAAQSNNIGGSTATPGQGAGNVISGNQQAGVRLTTGGGQNLVQGNIIGLNAAGNAAVGNLGAAGVFLSGGAQDNTIGGSSSSLRNIISGNGSSNIGDGVEFFGSGTSTNTVAGNYIGTDINGTADIGNAGSGVLSSNGATRNTIGGLTSTPGTAPGNVISGNSVSGVSISGGTSSPTNNTVQGNIIGLNAAGSAALRNDSRGVLISGGSEFNLIGGTTTTARNILSGNNTSGAAGVEINASNNNTVQGNYIGTNASGTASLPNSIGVFITAGSQSNSIGGILTGAVGTAPGNVISGNNGNGIEIGGTNTSANTVRGNLIGFQANGTTTLRNGSASDGIRINSPSANNIIGGTTSTARNVITGGASTGDAIEINGTNASSNTIQGNYIGTDINGTGINASPTDFGAGRHGVIITGGGDNNQIGGSATTPGTAPGNVISGHGSNGINIDTGSTGTLVQGNLIGTQANGTTDYANGSGVFLSGATGNTIGGSTPTPGTGLGNVISGNNGNGVTASISANTNLIQGNLIGLQAGGNAPLGNASFGVSISGSTGCTVGGTTTDLRNVISANTLSGVLLISSSNNSVQGNLIGTRIDGTTAQGNGHHGVNVSSSSNNVIGGTATATSGNTIAFQGLDGVFVESGTGNNIRRNSIHSNTGLGIDLGADGVTANDGGTPPDTDTGANNLQNFPVITSAVNNGATTTIQGTLQSTPSTAFTIEVFSNAVGCDPTGFGEGQTYLGTTTATTDANGNATWSLVHGAPLTAGLNLTATATDPANNTSEFSACALVTLPPITVTIDDLMIAEGNIGQVQAVLTVRLSATSGSDVTVSYTTANDTATAPADYQAESGTVTIPAGSLTGTFDILINGDTIFEGNERFFVNLTGVTTNNAVIADSQAIVTINDDEPTNADFDGDGRTDASVWRSSTGDWFWHRSSDNTVQTHVDWGRDTLGDIAVPGDYDGDNKTDLAVWRPSEGNWYIVNSSFGQPGGASEQTTVKGWGGQSYGDVPVPADYDNDGKTDIAVWRAPEGTWYIINSSDQSVTTRGWGSSALGDKPVVGDYDGDGKADIAVWRAPEGNWYIINSSTNTVTLRAWGLGSLGDLTVQADYDGDGKTDIAVWRPSEGNWYIINSRDDSITVKGWGAGSLNDVPVPGNYDGDNKADIAVWRPAEANWYIISSRDNVVIMFNLGQPGDTLIPAAYYHR